MILKVKTSADIPPSEITPETLYPSPREFLETAAGGAPGAVAGAALLAVASSATGRHGRPEVHDRHRS